MCDSSGPDGVHTLLSPGVWGWDRKGALPGLLQAEADLGPMSPYKTSLAAAQVRGGIPGWPALDSTHTQCGGEGEGG